MMIWYIELVSRLYKQVSVFYTNAHTKQNMGKSCLIANNGILTTLAVANCAAKDMASGNTNLCVRTQLLQITANTQGGTHTPRCTRAESITR